MSKIQGIFYCTLILSFLFSKAHSVLFSQKVRMLQILSKAIRSARLTPFQRDFSINRVVLTGRVATIGTENKVVSQQNGVERSRLPISVSSVYRVPSKFGYARSIRLLNSVLLTSDPILKKELPQVREEDQVLVFGSLGKMNSGNYIVYAGIYCILYSWEACFLRGCEAA